MRRGWRRAVSSPTTACDDVVSRQRFRAAYKSAATLEAMHKQRLEWYGLRLNMGDGSTVPFPFLHHAQTKILAQEVATEDVPCHRRLSCLYSRLHGADARAAGSPPSSGSRRFVTPRPHCDSASHETGTVRDSTSEFSSAPPASGYRTDSGSDSDDGEECGVGVAAALSVTDVTLVPALKAAPTLVVHGGPKKPRRRRMSTQEMFYFGERDERDEAKEVTTSTAPAVPTLGVQVVTPRANDEAKHDTGVENWNAPKVGVSRAGCSTLASRRSLASCW